MPAPAQPEPTVADLAERFMCAHVEVNCKPATAGFYSLALDNTSFPPWVPWRSARLNPPMSRPFTTRFEPNPSRPTE